MQGSASVYSTLRSILRTCSRKYTANNACGRRHRLLDSRQLNTSIQQRPDKLSRLCYTSHVCIVRPYASICTEQGSVQLIKKRIKQRRYSCLERQVIHRKYSNSFRGSVASKGSIGGLMGGDHGSGDDSDSKKGLAEDYTERFREDNMKQVYGDDYHYSSSEYEIDSEDDSNNSQSSTKGSITHQQNHERVGIDREKEVAVDEIIDEGLERAEFDMDSDYLVDEYEGDNDVVGANDTYHWISEIDILFYSVDEIISFVRGLKATPGWRKRLFSNDYNTRDHQTQNLCSRVETMVGEFQSHHYSLLVYVLNRVVGSQRDKYKFTDLVHLMVAQATRRYKQNHMSIEEMLTFAHEVRQAEVYSAELSHFMLNVLNDMLISIEDRHLVLLQNQFKNGKSYPSEVIDMMCMRLLTSSPSAITGADLAVLCMSIHDWDDVGQKVLVDLSPMVLKKAPKLGGQDAANVLYAYGRQGVFQEDIYRELCEQLCVVVDDLEIRHMQQISDAFQYFNYKHDALLECMARHTGTIVEAGAPEDYPEQIVQLFRYTVNCGCFVGRPELSLPVVRYMEMAVESATVEDLSHFTVSYGTVLRGVNGMNAYSEEMMKNIGEAILKLDKSALDPRDSANIVFGLGMLAPMTTGSINRVNQAARDFVHVFEDPAFMQELKAVPMGRFMAGFGAINFPFRVTSLNNCGDVILDNAIQTFTRHHLYQASTENLSLFLGGLANYGYVGFLERETVMDRIRKFHTQDTYQDINKGSQSSNQDLFALTPSRAVALLSAVCKLRLLATQDHDTIELKEAQRKAVVVLNAALLSSTELSMGDVASYAEAVGMLAINHPENTSHAGAVKSAWERVIMPKLRAHTRDGTCTPLSATENRQLWDGYLALKHLYPDAVKRFQTDDTEVVKGLKYTRTDEDVFQQGLGWNEASRGTTTNVLNKFLMYIAEALRQDGYGVVDTYTPYVHERTGYTLNATLLVDPSSVPTGDTASTNGKSRTRGKLKPVLVYIIMQPDTAYIQANEVVTQREPSTRMIGGVTSMRGSREATEVKMSVEPNGTVLMRDRLLGYNGVCVLGLNMRDLNELRQVQRVEFATKLIKVMVDAEAAA